MEQQEEVQLHQLPNSVMMRLHDEACKAYLRENPWVVLPATYLMFVATKPDPTDDARVYGALAIRHSGSLANIVVVLPAPYTREELLTRSTGVKPGLVVLTDDQARYIIESK